MRLRKIREQFEGKVSIQWRPFALRPEPLPEPFAFQGSYVERGWQSAALMTQSDGITYRPWDRGPLPRWSMPGLFAGAAALRQGPEAWDRFHSEMFAAFFSRNEDITQKEVVSEVARGAGLDVDAFERDFEQPTIRESVRRAVGEAYRADRVTAVPTVIIGGKHRLQGAVPATDYLQALADCGLEVGDAIKGAPSSDVLSTGWVDLGEVRGSDD